MQPELERCALVDHLARRGLDAEGDGCCSAPVTSAIAGPTRPRSASSSPPAARRYLQPLLDGLHERTRYPNYEVIIVDNDNRDPDTLRFLAALEHHPDLATGPA